MKRNQLTNAKQLGLAVHTQVQAGNAATDYCWLAAKLPDAPTLDPRAAAQASQARQARLRGCLIRSGDADWWKSLRKDNDDCINSERCYSAVSECGMSCYQQFRARKKDTAWTAEANKTEWEKCLAVCGL